jgi:hypothetical protein
MLRKWTGIIVASTLTFSCFSVSAQTENVESVTGIAQSAVQIKPTALRFQLDLREDGDDMDAVLKSLDRSRDAYKKALLASKAAKESIKADGPKLLSPLQAEGAMVRQRQYLGKGQVVQQANPLAQPSKPQGYPPGRLKQMPRIIVQYRLTAEWPLEGKTASALLVEADRIVRGVHGEIKAAVPQDAPPVAQPNPSEKDSIDPDDSQDESAINVPHYLFVGKISDKQLRKSRVEAFEKAKSNAVALAELGGCRIGTLLGLSASYEFNGEGADNSLGPGFDRFHADVDDFDRREASAPDPSNLWVHVHVSASFRLK